MRQAFCLMALGSALLVFAPGAGAKTMPGSPPFRVVIVNSLGPAQLRQLGARGAVGLLVPEVGPTTNRRQALAALVRGAEVNARLGGVPAGPPLISPSSAVRVPPETSPEIVVSLPPRGAPQA